MIRPLRFFLAASLLLAACVPTTWEESPADTALSHWIGLSVTELRASWGEPSTSYLLGSEIISIWYATNYPPSYFPINQTLAEPQTFRGNLSGLPCRAEVRSDESGTITAAEWVGYECTELF